ncbi:MAG: histidine phosphatase family protein [Anaerolineae bacterium]|nr:histidine phosphatase family protein [Anaerolineae bacterium]
MTQILLIRHAVNDYVKTGRLAGWTPGVHLNDEGKAQAEALVAAAHEVCPSTASIPARSNAPWKPPRPSSSITPAWKS